MLQYGLNLTKSDYVTSHVSGNEPQGSIRGRKFLDYWSNYLFLKKDTVLINFDWNDFQHPLHDFSRRTSC